MRFGIRLGPFWVSTSTRRRRPQRPTQAQAAKAAKARKDAEDFAMQQRLAAMTPEEYRRHAEATDPVYREWLRRREAGIDAELDRLKPEGHES